tara:strand:- start:6073 stop:7800 length:1728 start_codon:yes stop_codon:yes gene_type:complete
MAVLKVSKPALTAPADFKESNAKGYVMRFTKDRYDQYKLAADQAKFEATTDQELYKLNVEAYQAQLNALSDEMIELEKARGDAFAKNISQAQRAEEFNIRSKNTAKSHYSGQAFSASGDVATSGRKGKSRAGSTEDVDKAIGDAMIASGEDIGGAFRGLDSTYEQTGSGQRHLPKDYDSKSVGYATMASSYATEVVEQSGGQMSYEEAYDAVKKSIPPDYRGMVEHGEDLAIKDGKAKRTPQGYRPVLLDAPEDADLSYYDQRLKELQAEKAGLVVPEYAKPDMIDLTRDIYFDKYGGRSRTPNYVRNQKMDALLSYVNTAGEAAEASLFDSNPAATPQELLFAKEQGRADAINQLKTLQARPSDQPRGPAPVGREDINLDDIVREPLDLETRALPIPAALEDPLAGSDRPRDEAGMVIPAPLLRAQKAAKAAEEAQRKTEIADRAKRETGEALEAIKVKREARAAIKAPVPPAMLKIAPRTVDVQDKSNKVRAAASSVALVNDPTAVDREKETDYGKIASAMYNLSANTGEVDMKHLVSRMSEVYADDPAKAQKAATLIFAMAYQDKTKDKLKD